MRFQQRGASPDIQVIGMFPGSESSAHYNEGQAPISTTDVLPGRLMATSPALHLLKVAEADFPSRFGHFRIHGFEGRYPSGTEESVVLAMGDLLASPPLVRIHSQCLTGDVFHSLRCDCRAQLELALEMVGEEGRGLIIYEHQEGRGIGLMNKLRAYQLQDQGADTVEANERLGFKADLREYSMPGAILQYFGLDAIRLLSNNPDKIRAVEAAGIRVTERVPCHVPPSATFEQYLRIKREKLGHLL